MKPGFWIGPAFLALGSALAMSIWGLTVWKIALLALLLFFGLIWVEASSSSARGAAKKMRDNHKRNPSTLLDSDGVASRHRFPQTHTSKPLAPAPRWGSADPLD